MAYRTYVGTTGKDSIQILGNNESYKPFLDELKRQGYTIDKDLCYGLEFDDNGAHDKYTPVKDIQPIIEVLEKYIEDKAEEVKKIYNEDIFDLRAKGPEIDKDFTFRMMQLQENAYIFVTANLVNYLKDNLEQEYDIKKHKFIYKIKEGKEVWFSAY